MDDILKLLLAATAICVVGLSIIKVKKRKKNDTWGGYKIRLLVTNSEVTYTDFHNNTVSISWDEMNCVLWQPDAPEYGYCNWVVLGNGKSMEIDERSAAKEDLLNWFVERLSGFDRVVVEKATESGYFEADEYKSLVCWTKQKP